MPHRVRVQTSLYVYLDQKTARNRFVQKQSFVLERNSVPTFYWNAFKTKTNKIKFLSSTVRHHSRRTIYCYQTVPRKSEIARQSSVTIVFIKSNSTYLSFNICSFELCPSVTVLRCRAVFGQIRFARSIWPQFFYRALQNFCVITNLRYATIMQLMVRFPKL